MDLATARVPDIDNRHVRFGGPVTFGWTSDDFGPDGHIGDPTGASAEAGARMFAGIVTALAEAMGEVRDFAF
jgi:creatinine amidohydrolase